MAEPKVTRIPVKLENMLRSFNDLFTNPGYNNFTYMVTAITACVLPKTSRIFMEQLQIPARIRKITKPTGTFLRKQNGTRMNSHRKKQIFSLRRLVQEKENEF